MSIITRFAPSPTGDLHLGSVRTALYCWLYAKHKQGKFILRIEDTDRDRSTKEAVQVILDGMRWLGLDCDVGPVYQTEKLARYREVVVNLLAQGKAYKCYCSKERLDTLREEQMSSKIKPRYDGFCLQNNPQNSDAPFVIRFKNPQDGAVIIDDLIHGSIKVNNTELDDLILVRSDGMPTYNFSVVVDDWDMQVSHVIRGDDHINNTPRQINLFNALGAKVPQFAHLPMIHGPDGKKLSKRHGAVSVLEYQKQGFLPEALLNYLLRLGWAHGDQEIFKLDEMIELFDIAAVHKSPARFDLEKLTWMNQQYLKAADNNYLAEQLKPFLQDLNLTDGPDLTAVIEIQKERVTTLVAMAAQSKCFYQDDLALDESAAKKHLRPLALEILQDLQEQFSQLENWNKSNLHDIIYATAESFYVKLGKVAQPLRVAVTGGNISPAIDITLELVGAKRTIARLEQAIKYIQDRIASAVDTN